MNWKSQNEDMFGLGIETPTAKQIPANDHIGADATT
jgi:hypothetical protein